MTNLRNRIERLEQRSVSPSRLVDALHRYRDTGRLPKCPRLSQVVQRFSRAADAMRASVPEPPQPDKET